MCNTCEKEGFNFHEEEDVDTWTFFKYFLAIGMVLPIPIGLFFFFRLPKARRQEWLNFHCQCPKKHWRWIFPLAIYACGACALITWENPNE